MRISPPVLPRPNAINCRESCLPLAVVSPAKSLPSAVGPTTVRRAQQSPQKMSSSTEDLMMSLPLRSSNSALSSSPGSIIDSIGSVSRVINRRALGHSPPFWTKYYDPYGRKARILRGRLEYHGRSSSPLSQASSLGAFRLWALVKQFHRSDVGGRPYCGGCPLTRMWNAVKRRGPVFGSRGSTLAYESAMDCVQRSVVHLCRV